MEERKLISGNGNHVLCDKTNYNLTEFGDGVRQPRTIHICNQHASVKNEISLYVDNGSGTIHYYFHKLILPNGTALVYELEFTYISKEENLILRTEDSDSGNSTSITVLMK